MSRTVAAAALAAVAVLALAATARAQNIVIRPPDRIPTDPTPPPSGAVDLDVRSLAVETRIRGRVATTTIDQVFFNPSSSQLEGTYLFPLPEGAAIERFTMFVDGQELVGELLDADRARSIYEGIVRARRDPALLEFVGTRLFRARIFPIPPRTDKRVRLSYTEMLSGDTGSVTWRFPLGNARHGGKPVGRATVVVDLETPRPLAAVYSPTHPLDVVRRGDRAARASWEAADVLPERDFALVWQEPTAELGFSFLPHREAGEEGSFLFLVSPSVDPDVKPIPRDVVFCLDTSGSMAGEKIQQARGALRYGVRSLSPGDRFAIVTFATEPRTFRDALVPASKDEVEAALAFIDGIQAVGGTAIDEALARSLAFLADGDAARPGVVLFATDGCPTIGERDPAAILARSKGLAPARVRLFSFGVGHDVNTRLIDLLADELRGARDYVAPAEDIEVRVSALVAKTSYPVLTDVTLSVEGVAVHDIYPRRLPDLFRGSELALLGRYAGSGPAVVRVRGRSAAGPREFVQEVNFPAKAGDTPSVGRLWALRRVGFLMDEIRLRGETAELKDEVVRLAKRHGILTPYTSYLVLEDERLLQRDGRRADLPAEGRDRPQSDEFLRRLRGEVDAPAREAAAGGGADSGWTGGPAAGQPAPPSAPADGGAGAPVGAAAVGRSMEAKGLKDADDAEERGAAGERLRDLMRTVEGRTFYLRNGVWFDGGVDRDATRRRVVQFSDEYMALVRGDRALARFFALGKVVVKHGDVIYEVVEEVAPR